MKKILKPIPILSCIIVLLLIISISKTQKINILKEEMTETVYDIFEPGVQATGDPLVTNGVVTRQAGNIVFSLKQADALKDDTDVRLYGYCPGMINIASGTAGGDSGCPNDGIGIFADSIGIYCCY